MNIKLIDALSDSCQELSYPISDIQLFPSEFADLSTNLALKIAQKIGLSPELCAKQLCSQLRLPKEIARVAPAANGMINFFFTDDFKTKVIIDLANYAIAYFKDDEPLVSEPGQARRQAWEKSLKQWGLEAITHHLQFGQTTLSEPFPVSDRLQFFYLQSSAQSDLHLSPEMMNSETFNNAWYSIEYARKRNHHVLMGLQNRGVSSVSCVLSEQWPEFSLPLLQQLLRFNYLFDEIKQNGQVNELHTYLKNLARTMHCYYNRVTLLPTNPIMCSANYMLLQAAQRVLTNSLKLLGVNVE